MSLHTFLIGFVVAGACVLVLLLLSRRWPAAQRMALAVAALFMLYVGVDSLVWSIDDIRAGRLADVTRSGSRVFTSSAQSPVMFWTNAGLRVLACLFLMFCAAWTLRRAVRRS